MYGAISPDFLSHEDWHVQSLSRALELLLNSKNFYKLTMTK
jgi:hypothetical protein